MISLCPPLLKTWWRRQLHFLLRQNQDFADPVPKRNKLWAPTKRIVIPARPDTSVCCLPELCPLPNTFSRTTIDAIEQGQLLATAKTRMLRETATFYFGVYWHARLAAALWTTLPSPRHCARSIPSWRIKCKQMKNTYWVSCCSVKY